MSTTTQEEKPNKDHKTYADVVIEEHGDKDSQDKEESASDGYLDEYTEDSMFSESIYSEEDQEEEEASQPSIPAVIGADTRFSSGTSSPNPLSETRAKDALAPSHLFVSNTPWGSSTGRLTRGQRHKAQLWDDPTDKPAFTEINPNTSAGNESSTEQHDYVARLTQQLQMQQQRLQQMQMQIKQQERSNQVVNVVSVPQGSKGYSQLQEQHQMEQRLHQDMLESKLGQTNAPPRIVTIAQFIKSVTRLLGIGFPSAGCTEARLTVALVAVLGVRTGLDVWFANFNARAVRAVVTYDRPTLLARLLPEYLGMMVPMAAVNQTIKWVISSLTIALRVRLGRYAHQRYVDGITNITWNQLNRRGPSGSTPAYERPDWLLTVQIHRFADMLPRLVADVVKPTMDWFVFSRLLSRFIGRRGSLTMVLYVVLANVIIKLSSPPAGKHATRLAQLEDKYKSVYARISSTIQRAAAANTPLLFQQQQQQQQQQPVLSPDQTPDTPPAHQNGKRAFVVPRVQPAFRQQAQDSLDGSLNNVAGSVVSANIRRFFGGIGETVLAKYGATLTAYYLLARPLCAPGRRLASEILHDPAAVMMSYSRNSAYLINLSQATTRLLLMVNDLPKFVWSTVKVDRLLRSLDVHAQYRAEAVNDESVSSE